MYAAVRRHDFLFAPSHGVHGSNQNSNHLKKNNIEIVTTADKKKDTGRLFDLSKISSLVYPLEKDDKIIEYHENIDHYIEKKIKK